MKELILGAGRIDNFSVYFVIDVIHLNIKDFCPQSETVTHRMDENTYKAYFLIWD